MADNTLYLSSLQSERWPPVRECRFVRPITVGADKPGMLVRLSPDVLGQDFGSGEDRTDLVLTTRFVGSDIRSIDEFPCFAFIALPHRSWPSDNDRAHAADLGWGDSTEPRRTRRNTDSDDAASSRQCLYAVLRLPNCRPRQRFVRGRARRLPGQSPRRSACAWILPRAGVDHRGSEGPTGSADGRVIAQGARKRDDRARGADPLDDRFVAGRHVVGQHRRAVRGADPACLVGVLVHDR